MLNTIKAITFGHAVADALGVPVEFCSREWLNKHPVTDMMGYGTYNMPEGCWSDDTSMSLCALDVLANGNLDYDAIMRNFCAWYYRDEFTPTDELFDIGNTCRDAILTYVDLGRTATECGRNDEYSNGNGSLMRMYPFVLYAYYNNMNDKEAFVDIITSASSLTHRHQRAINGCIIYSYILRELIKNPIKNVIYMGIGKAQRVVGCDSAYSNLWQGCITGSTDISNIKGSGYVVDSLKAAIWCVLSTDSYEECVLKAVNLGDDTDTTAAIAGSLAGALYGYDAIPTRWLDKLKKKEMIDAMCIKAFENWR